MSAIYARDFLDAQEGLIAAAKIQPTSGRRAFCLAAANALSGSQRFHIPYGLDVAGERQYEELWPLMRLPFSSIAIHSLVGVGDTAAGPFKYFLRCITVASQKSENEISIISIIRNHSKEWGLIPAIASVSFDNPGLSINVDCLHEAVDTLDKKPETWPREFLSDLNRITDLCLMLNLRNVSSEEVQPDAQLQKARQRKGKPLLPSYHVLKVAGDVWHHRLNHEATLEGEGYRSHMRRGHIRRLDEDRQVWVRPTFVQGKKEGFAGKEYHLLPTKQPAQDRLTA